MVFEVSTHILPGDFAEFQKFCSHKSSVFYRAAILIITAAVSLLFAATVKKDVPLIPVFILTYIIFFSTYFISEKARFNKMIANAVADGICQHLSQKYTFNSHEFSCEKGTHPVPYQDVNATYTTKSLLLLEVQNAYYILPKRDLTKEQMEFLSQKIKFDN